MRIITINILNYIFANALYAKIKSTCEHIYMKDTHIQRKNIHTTYAIHGRRRWRRQFHARRTRVIL